MKHVLVVGIERLMTGLQVATEKQYDMTFERESASTIRILCDSPITAYWPVKQCTTYSTAFDKVVPEKFSEGEVEHVVEKVARAMAVADIIPTRDDHLPWPVIKSMRRKFGVRANDYLRPSMLKSYGTYWGFEYAGMFHGVEPDGYIHT